MFKYLNNRKGGMSQLQVFFVLIVPIVMILSLLMGMGEYWYKAQVLDELNARFVTTIVRQGVVDGVPGAYDTTKLSSLIDEYYSNVDSTTKTLLGECTLTFSARFGARVKEGLTPADFLSHAAFYGIGRNSTRQDYVGAYIRSNKQSLLGHILTSGIGWFYYSGADEAKYESYFIGDAQPWID